MPSSTAAQPRSIVVIGGGIVGSSIAYYLSQAIVSTAQKTKVTLLESSPAPAPAASGKAAGFLALDWHGPATASLAALSFRLHRELAESDNGSEKWGYREVEAWQIQVDSTLSKKARATNSRRKTEFTWLDNKIVATSTNMGGGGSTAQVTPGALTQHLVDRARLAGVQALFSTSAVRLQFGNDGEVNGVETQNTKTGDRELLAATDIVVAAGPWTGSLLTKLFPHKLMPTHLRAAASIDGSRAHSIILESPSDRPLSADCLFTEMSYGPNGCKAGAPELYCRPDGTAYVCGGSDDVPLPATADEVTFDETKISALIEQSKVLSPSSLDLEQGAILRAKQACYLPISNRTGNPIIGGKNGIYVAAGHSCWGITNSLGTGKVLTELILEGHVKSAEIDSLMP